MAPQPVLPLLVLVGTHLAQLPTAYTVCLTSQVFPPQFKVLDGRLTMVLSAWMKRKSEIC